MHVIVATDGSKQSLAAAKQLKSFADPAKITDISVVAVIRPLAASRSPTTCREHRKGRGRAGRFRDAAEGAVATVAAVFDGWGPKVHKKIRSGSPANEIIRAAEQYDAGLVVVASGGRGLSDACWSAAPPSGCSTTRRARCSSYAPSPARDARPDH